MAKKQAESQPYVSIELQRVRHSNIVAAEFFRGLNATNQEAATEAVDRGLRIAKERTVKRMRLMEVRSAIRHIEVTKGELEGIASGIESELGIVTDLPFAERPFTVRPRG